MFVLFSDTCLFRCCHSPIISPYGLLTGCFLAGVAYTPCHIYSHFSINCLLSIFICFIIRFIFCVLFGNTFVVVAVVWTNTLRTQKSQSQSPEDSLMDSAKNSRTDHNHWSQLLDSPATDSDDNSLDNWFPKIPIEMEPVQLMNQLLMQLIMKPMIEIHPAPFAGTAVENILNWLESVNGIATHNVWNDRK